MREPHRLRIKHDPIVPDPAWYDLQRYPNSWTVEVGGIPTAGNWTVTVVTEDGTSTIPTTFARVAEDDATTADELRQLMEANALLDPFLETITDDDAGVILAVGQSARGPTFHRPYRVTVTAPAPGTLTLAPDDVYPLTEQVPDGFSTARFSFVGLDVAGVVLPNNAPDTKLDITVIGVTTGTPRHGVEERHITRLSESLAHPITDEHTVTGLAVGTEITVRIGDLANPHPDLDAIAVWVEWI